MLSSCVLICFFSNYCDLCIVLRN
ncbi:hypothetical protein OIU76_008264 [Salix suchowensis]|nr:hypothetical protein OIU76_008264 [Salix suchowensis]